MTTRIAQMSDLHFCSVNLEESNRTFGFAVDHAIAIGMDAAIITGDSTDHAMDAHSPAVLALVQHIQRLAGHMPVLMLQGTFSHEPPGFLKLLPLLSTAHKVSVADKIGTWVLATGDDGRKSFSRFTGDLDASACLVVRAVPTMNKADILALDPQATEADIGIRAGAIIGNILRSWAQQSQTLRAKGVPSMVISHGTVLGSMTEHGVPMSGTDHEYTVGSLFAAEAEAVALGHIHKHQVWSKCATGLEQKIAYPGSIGRFHFGEMGDKGYLQWELNAGSAQIQFVATPARQTIELSFEGEPDLGEIRAIAEECAGKHVRIRFIMDAEHVQNVNRAAIREILKNAEKVQIEGIPVPVERKRSEGISSETSVSGKLDKWGVSTDIGRDRLMDLQRRLALLNQNLSASEIAMHSIKPVQPVIPVKAAA